MEYWNLIDKIENLLEKFCNSDWQMETIVI
jgi:hypothetical protein